MQKRLLAVILLLFLSLPTFIWAGHSYYVNGLDGLKVFNMPAMEGLYLKTYAAFSIMPAKWSTTPAIKAVLKSVPTCW